MGSAMKATRQLQELGQSLWLDNITRELLASGTLRRYINELSISGVTSNPTIFERAFANSDGYDSAITNQAYHTISEEELFLDLALQDLTQAANLLRPIYDASGGRDGWVSLEVSPLLANDTAGTVKAAVELYSRACQPNLFIKIPATPAGIAAIEEALFEGVPVNVTLLFSPEQYLAAANAYLAAIERRLAADLDPNIASVASLFVSRWDAAVNDQVPRELRNRLGIAIAMQTYSTYREMLASPRWQRLAEAGAQAQRLLWASTGSKDPEVAETLYVEALAAADTINTLPEKTLLAFAEYGRVGTSLSPDGGDARLQLQRFEQTGINLQQLAADLQRAGVAAFAKSWIALLDCLAAKRAILQKNEAQVV